ncbi:hypothetical protein GLE_5178 [Lysobacter enzymogenes]|uniref:Uncharacterized protein n=1 Tax=Lysobacter enzymogenes TaxID=69 RepID=A0A0S2DPC1_LYSEN|nr:hypothetical protein GLE_5178 [Lysobacter enzymogenes]
MTRLHSTPSPRKSDLPDPIVAAAGFSTHKMKSFSFSCSAKMCLNSK